jgi:hypothetical protein
MTTDDLDAGTRAHEAMAIRRMAIYIAAKSWHRL